MKTNSTPSRVPTPTTVVNVRNAEYDIYVGRPTIWGNPFIIGKDGTRAEVIAKYEEWLRTNSHLLALLPTLRGYRLGCHCAPRDCHGAVLARLADRYGALDDLAATTEELGLEY